MPRCLSLPAAFLIALAAGTALSAFIVPRSAFAAIPATAPTSQAALDPARLPALIQRLGNPDFAQREAAQKELDQATWRDLDILQSAADATTDPEIKARLSARIAGISENLAFNPSPISLELKNASLREVADALGKALHVKFEVRDGFAPGLEPRFTLSAKDQSFWEVFCALSRQRSILLDASTTPWLLEIQDSAWRAKVPFGPLLVIPTDITRQRKVLLPDQLQPETTTLHCTFILDPRVIVLKWGEPRFTEIRDDLGNDLAPPLDLRANANGGENLLDAMEAFHGHVMSPDIALKTADKRGTRIVSAKGSVHYVVQAAEDHIDIPDADTKAGQTFEIAGNTVKLESLGLQPDHNSVNFNIQLVRATALPANMDNNGPTAVQRRVNITVTDATGQEICVGTIQGSMRIRYTPITPPLKLHLSVPTKTKDLVIPFELKDLLSAAVSKCSKSGGLKM